MSRAAALGPTPVGELLPQAHSCGQAVLPVETAWGAVQRHRGPAPLFTSNAPAQRQTTSTISKRAGGGSEGGLFVTFTTRPSLSLTHEHVSMLLVVFSTIA
jgi:hypothetical protein